MFGQRSKHIRYMTIADETDPFQTECGKTLREVVLAYETYGRLNEDMSNAILITHAFSGDSHVGTHPDEPELRGWWGDFVGPGRVFDTSKFFVICSNVLGGCMGSTGPTSINPDTGKPYNLSFPIITITDMVNAQKRLLDRLGVSSLVAVTGGSMGGMQALQWGVSYPDYVKAVIPIATTTRLSPQGIAFNEVARRAIVNDPKWNNGNYPLDDPPVKGLALARMIAHITYLSNESMHSKFGRERVNSDKYLYKFCTEFEVESYLDYQGHKFTKRFDANTFLYMTKAIDYFDLEKAYGSLYNAFKSVRAKFLIISFETDWLYPIYQGKEMVSALRQAEKEVTYAQIPSTLGHDAFLLEYKNMKGVISPFLEQFLE